MCSDVTGIEVTANLGGFGMDAFNGGRFEFARQLAKFALPERGDTARIDYFAYSTNGFYRIHNLIAQF